MIVGGWTGKESLALRKALRMSQEEFAFEMGYTKDTVYRWEHLKHALRGKSAQDLDSRLEGLDDRQLRRFKILLAAAYATSPSEDPGQGGVTPSKLVAVEQPAGEYGLYTWEVDGDVRRREFGRAAAAGAALLYIGSQGRIGTSDVQRLLDGVDALEQEDQCCGGAALVDFALEQLACHKHTLDTGAYDTATGTALASATGQLAVLTGWLAYDADRHQQARRCYSDAMALGTESGDGDLIAHTCLYAANHSLALSSRGEGSPARALMHIDQARQLMRGKPPGRIHVLIAIREAQARGVLGDRAAFGRSISTAWRELGEADEFEPLSECPSWLRSVNHSEVRGHEARGWTRVGEPAKAVELFELAVQQDDRVRNALNNRACLASARAGLGDISGALRDAEPILTDLETTVTSIRTLRALTPLRTAVTDNPKGAAFRHRFDTLTTQASPR